MNGKTSFELRPFGSLCDVVESAITSPGFVAMACIGAVVSVWDCAKNGKFEWRDRVASNSRKHKSGNLAPPIGLPGLIINNE